jgi:hypothetical protein
MIYGVLELKCKSSNLIKVAGTLFRYDSSSMDTLILELEILKLNLQPLLGLIGAGYLL